MDVSEIVVTGGGLFLIAFTLWFFFGKGALPVTKGSATLYSCPMHPWITSSDPTAECSICGMKLVES